MNRASTEHGKKTDERSGKKRETGEAEESRVYTDVIEMVWAIGIRDGVYVYVRMYVYIRIILSPFRCFSFSLSVCTRGLCTGTRRTGTPTTPRVTQVTHHSSCTHGNRVDSDLSPINKPFRMPTRSARTSTTPK